MGTETTIRLTCDYCDGIGIRYNPNQVGGYYGLRMTLNRAGWLFTSTKDFCSQHCFKNYQEESGRKLKLVNFYNYSKRSGQVF